MKKIDTLFLEYGESHQNNTNKLLHWFCIPIIMFSLVGILYTLPMPIQMPKHINWASFFVVFALVYYLKLSINIFLGFLPIIGLMLFGNIKLAEIYGVGSLHIISLSLFFVAWIGQFIGHKIEGKKPSFFKDLQFLLIGPAWLLHFIYKKMNITY